MISKRQRYMIRVALGLALGAAAVPAQASVILDTTYISFTPDGTQFGRISRDGNASVWGEQKDFPGIIGAPAAFNYELFTIDSDVFSFVQISLDDPASVLFASAYLGAFTPVSAAPNYGLDTNYLGDAGSSQPFGNPSFFQIAVAPHSQIVIPIATTTAGTGGGIGATFDLIVEGFLDADYTDIPDWQPGGGTPVPEPATSVLFGSALALSAMVRTARRLYSRQRA